MKATLNKPLAASASSLGVVCGLAKARDTCGYRCAFRPITHPTPRRVASRGLIQRRLKGPQRGGATLAITVLLSLVMLLVVAFANRNLLFELHSAANHYRATQAFEAADAGLDWALAQLNNPSPINAHCLPSAASGDIRYRERVLGTGAPWAPHGRAARCQKNSTDSHWACQCPEANGNPLPPLSGDAPTPSFSVRVLPGPRPDLLQVVATGCSDTHAPCQSEDNTDTGAVPTARLKLTLGTLPLLAAAPDAALTARGTVQWAGEVQLHRLEPTGSGLALHAGGKLEANTLRAIGPPGSPGNQAVLADDRPLATHSAHALFLSLFRLDPAAWQAQPLVQRVACETACDSTVAALLAHAGPHSPLWLPHGLRLDTPLALGSAAHPVLLVIDGPVQLNGAVQIHGLVYARAPEWADRAGAAVHGAVVFETDVRGTGPTHLHHHTGVLQTLRNQAGTLARVAGSWRDFE